MRYLAQDINEKLQYVHNKGGHKIELIGHSVGAHAAGQAGRLFKKYTGNEVNRIVGNTNISIELVVENKQFFSCLAVGLDPAAPFFKDNPQLALNGSDATNVMVFHTNTDRYGVMNEIGPNDTFVNGGTKQPECKRKLTDNICSHNRGWEVYSDHLKNINTTTVQRKNKRLHSDRFVLCIDVSGSMDMHARLIRAIGSAEKLLSKMKIGSYIGIVTFNHEAQMNHDIIQIKDDVDRQKLISELPKEASGMTSIGAGLNLSMILLKKLPESQQFCSTIILLSDGAENTKPYTDVVLPELQKACIGVNSVALGAEASDKLEKVSSQTKGNVFYAMESDNAQQITDTDRAFAFSYESEIDADIRPIYLPTKRLTLSNGENEVPFVIDKNIGKDTEITFTGDAIKNVDVNLFSPSGRLYTPDSPEYIDNSSSMQKIYKIKFAEPGKWNLVANQNAFKVKRSIRSSFDAIVTVKSNQLDDALPPIRLDASVSKRTLEYPKSNEPNALNEARILIYAELRRGQYPIIHAKILGHIQGVNEETVTFQLHDDGAFPDELANDGVYTSAITKLKQPQRYSVFVTATNANETAKLVPKEIDYFEREMVDCEAIDCEILSYFEREAYVGSIKLNSTDNEHHIPPNPITDLSATVHDETKKLIELQWTSPVDEAFDMHVKEYDIRALIDGQVFDHGFRLNESYHVAESNNGNDLNAKRMDKFLLRIPEQIWKYDKKRDEPGFFLELTFAVKAIGTNDETSPRSNLALVSIKDKPSVLINAHKVCKTIRRNVPRVGIMSITYC